MLSVRYSCHILMKIEFIDRFSKNTQITNLKKILPVAAELFHAERRTDGHTERHNEANSRPSQFGNASKIQNP
jgi:hypothetical protein